MISVPNIQTSTTDDAGSGLLPASAEWLRTVASPTELRHAMAAEPAGRYRPIPLWWWSGETLDEERLVWQLEQLAAMGCGGVCITGLALHGPAAGIAADDPPAYGEAWLKLFRRICERARALGLKVVAWSPLQAGAAADTWEAVERQPTYAGQVPSEDGRLEPLGFDWGNPDAVSAVTAPGTAAGAFLAALDGLLGDVVVAMFEDEFPIFAPWGDGFREQFEAAKGYPPPPAGFAVAAGDRTPAIRWDLLDVAASRIERAYTRWQREFVQRHGLLAGYDQMNRSGEPTKSSFCYFDPFRTMAWATAPGTDQMGDARFALSIADMSGAPRVWLEGFHSHGWGHRLADQARLLVEWGREGASLFLPHGCYYTVRAGWWEWAPPDMTWRQPYARHYPTFAAWVGRLMTALSAGTHDPEVAVLYPLSTVWAATSGSRTWEPEGHVASECYLDLFGWHHTPSTWEPERWRRPSLLAEAGYDRVAVDEAHADSLDIPLILPGCLCLRRGTVERLTAQAEAGRRIVIVEPVPAWSAEQGRDDAGFTAAVARLCAAAVVVDTPAAAVSALPPPRAEGLRALWRRVGDQELIFVTGTGPLRLRDRSDRRPEMFDLHDGSTAPHPAVVDGHDLVLDIQGPATLLALPPGAPDPPPPADATVEVPLPEVWSCRYLPWAENRWGDYRLPANEGSPPVERRTFAFREGDDDAWPQAPVVPEDVAHPETDLGFEERMQGRTGRPAPAERDLRGGWREVVSTYGPKAIVDGRTIEYSERLGVEDLLLSTHIGLKGLIEPVKVDLGEDGWGRVVSHVLLDAPVDTDLVVEGGGVATVSVDGHVLAGPVEVGVLAVPVRLSAGWHEVAIDVAPRTPIRSGIRGYQHAPRTRLAWAVMPGYERDPVAIWGGPMYHPDYKASQGPRRFRRVLVLDSPSQVRIAAEASGALDGPTEMDLDAGTHVIELGVGPSPGASWFRAAIVVESATSTSRLVSDQRWETAGATGPWEGAYEVGSVPVWAPGAVRSDTPRRHPLLDVAWLEGEAATIGHAESAWSDSPDPPPPAWFAFTAPPGATAITLPIVGDVQGWVDGQPASIEDGEMALSEHARVSLRVQAPAGRRGASCFTEHPLLRLGDGTIRLGTSWHRQGLDCFAGVLVHSTEIHLERDGTGILDLGEVAGTVAARVNGVEAGVLFAAPWRLPVQLRAGLNLLELEVANTLGPLMARGVPTPFGPEDQRTSGLLAQPVLRLEPLSA